MKELTLVIPAKNESECLPIVLNELKNIDMTTFSSMAGGLVHPPVMIFLNVENYLIF